MKKLLFVVISPFLLATAPPPPKAPDTPPVPPKPVEKVETGCVKWTLVAQLFYSQNPHLKVRCCRNAPR